MACTIVVQVNNIKWSGQRKDGTYLSPEQCGFPSSVKMTLTLEDEELDLEHIELEIQDVLTAMFGHYHSGFSYEIIHKEVIEQ